MPTVPRIERQIGEAPLPAPQLRVNVPNMAGAMDKTFAAADNLGQNILFQANQVFGLDANNKLEEAASILKNDALSKTGLDALSTDYKPNWEAVVAEIRKPASNDEQRFMVDKLASGHWATLDNAVKTHGIDEYRRYDTETTNASNNNATRLAKENYGNIPAIQNTIDTQHQIIVDYGLRNGKSLEWIKDTAANFSHTVIEGTIKEALVNGDDIHARRIFDENKQYILGDTTDIEALLKTASTSGEANRIVTPILNDLIQKNPTGIVTLFNVMQQVKTKTSDPNVIAAATTMAREYINEWDAQTKAIDDGNKQAVYAAAAKGGKLAAIQKMPEYMGMKGVEQDIFNQRMKTRIEHDANLATNTNDEKTKFTQAQRWGELISNPNLLRSTNLDMELVTRNIDETQYRGLTMAKEKQDPLKSNDAENAVSAIKRAMTQHIFNEDDSKNITLGTDALNLLQSSISNNWDKPGYNPMSVVEKLIEPAKDGFVRRVLDWGYESPEAKMNRLREEADKTAGTLTVPGAPVRLQPLTVPTSVTSPKKRVNGMVYDTPKGKMKWTGTGWLPTK